MTIWSVLASGAATSAATYGTKKQEILSCYGANQNVTKQTAITTAQ